MYSNSFRARRFSTCSTFIMFLSDHRTMLRGSCPLGFDRDEISPLGRLPPPRCLWGSGEGKIWLEPHLIWLAVSRMHIALDMRMLDLLCSKTIIVANQKKYFRSTNDAGSVFLKLFKPFYVFFLERSLVDTTTPVFYFNVYKRNQRSYNRLILYVNSSVTYDGHAQRLRLI